ncbi:Protein of unknown function DUF2240 [Methanolacinia petrolearia DSM 11571]|uniref:DUF2240 family protein n=1 Tax=Methanolacinia petrolearia (strain DSM 11571 / OCM 486 / SEBR 4847) TaxID=679926 RepID=E1RKA6_METP4|nr:DUF2240 family protein [Methanolacinia petrolearia]ADN36919.1 Protein of unknown function DUF2240 [Methanolacinia petrolearia DSM 11571]
MTLQMTIAAPFRNMGRNRLKKSEIVFYLAIDRHWMNREQAEKVISMADAEGLIRKEGDYFSIPEEFSKIDIPLGYKPSSEIFEKKDPVESLAAAIAEKNGIEINAVISEMNALMEDEFDGNLLPEAAIVILAREYGVGFEEYLDELKKSIGKID